MTTPLRSVASRPVWKALEAHHGKMRELHLRKLFTDDPKRGERFAIEAAGLCLDYSKNRITDETLKLLLQLAEFARSLARPSGRRITSPSRPSYLAWSSNS
jgi:glucose-6-phosphate isomerase